MDILERISQVRKEDYEFTGNVEDAVFVFKGVLGETLVKQVNFAGDAVKILAAFTEKPVQQSYIKVLFKHSLFLSCSQFQQIFLDQKLATQCLF